MKIEFEKLVNVVENTSYANSGASTEVDFGHYLQNDFPNSEMYWRKFIVPTTNRIYGNKSDANNREGISEDLLDIGSFHYTIFDHLFRAEESFVFENFYVRLGSICDLVEDFLLLIYKVKIECTGLKTKIAQQLTKKEFLEIADDWYEENYANFYQLYFKNGKHIPIKIPKSKNLIKEYYSEDKNDNPWKKYSSFSQGIKTYRNKIIHYYILARLIDNQRNQYVPKKEKVDSYKRWIDLQKALKDEVRLREDFIEEKKQMNMDLSEMKQVLNKLWQKPIKDMNELLYVQKNEVLLKKYDLEFI